MLIEVPDFGVIFNIIIAFLVGLVVFYVYHKIKPYVNIQKAKTGIDNLKRLEYYEQQLIDMKIRLDAMVLGDITQKTPEVEAAFKPQTAPKQTIEQKPQIIEETNQNKPTPTQRLPNMSTNNAANRALYLITQKPMTSHDIQITFGRSREHISRLMKKLFEGGYVERNEDVKPYTYSITQKGREKIEKADNQP